MKPQKRRNEWTKKKNTQKWLPRLPHIEPTTMASEIPSDIDRFGVSRRALPTQPPPPLSRLSINGNASVLLSMADINSRMMTHSQHSSKSNDAIYSQDISTITTSTRATSSHHFNIDELYVKSQPPMIRRNMGKRAHERVACASTAPICRTTHTHHPLYHRTPLCLPHKNPDMPAHSVYIHNYVYIIMNYFH